MGGSQLFVWQPRHHLLWQPLAHMSAHHACAGAKSCAHQRAGRPTWMAKGSVIGTFGWAPELRSSKMPAASMGCREGCCEQGHLDPAVRLRAAPSAAPPAAPAITATRSPLAAATLTFVFLVVVCDGLMLSVGLCTATPAVFPIKGRKYRRLQIGRNMHFMHFSCIFRKSCNERIWR